MASSSPTPSAISPSSLSTSPAVPSLPSLLPPPPSSPSSANADAPPPTTSNSAPPPTSSPSPPSLPNSPPPSAVPNAPPPTSLSPPPPTPSSPPPTTTPSPPQANPPSISPPPPTTPTLSPPTPQVSSPPPAIVSPPPPPLPSSSPPPPPLPSSSPPPPPLRSSSPPPPSADPPVPSPPSPVFTSPPPSGSNSPPSNALTPPPKAPPPTSPATTSPPTTNSTNGTSNPVVLSPPVASSPPLVPLPNSMPGGPGDNRSSVVGSNVTAGIGNGNHETGGGVKAGVIIVPVTLVSILVVVVGLAMWYFRKGKNKRKSGAYAAGFVMPSPTTPSQMSESSYPRSPTAPLVHHSSGSHGYISSPSDPGLGNSKIWFTYSELYNITDGFSHQRLLGEGGFGCVYKGRLQDGREVAVKQLKVGGSQGEREFAAEVEIIGRVHHRHLVSLVGYCVADKQRLLVYDYVPNNTLHHHLHAEEAPVLDWAIRVRVAAGAARGIAYLHEDCHPRIIHRDIKSSNILLDDNFEAQVSDFGLARIAMDAATHVTTRVMGTFGYLAPEYASSGKLTERSDVYSFGVVLLELITGRKPVDTTQPLGDESLVEWARPLLNRALETREFDGLPDPRLQNNYNESEMFRMIEAAAACVRHSASMRPRMSLVVRALDGIADIDLNNGMRPGQSELYSAHSEDIRMFQRMAFGSQDYSSDFSNFTRASWKSQRDS